MSTASSKSPKKISKPQNAAAVAPDKEPVFVRLQKWAEGQLDPSKKIKKPDATKAKLQSLVYGPVSAIVVTILAFIVASLMASVLIGVYPAAKGWDAARTDAWLGSSTWAQFFFYIFTTVITVGVLYYFLKTRQQSLAPLGVAKPSWRDVLFGSVAFPIYFILLVIATFITANFIPAVDVAQKQELGFVSVAGGELVLVFIALVILPPLLEEFLFRGFLFSGLRKKLSFLPTTIIVSALFGALHLSASSSGPLWIAAIDTAVLSFVLCYVREKTGSIWAGVWIHFIKNCLAFIGLFIIGVN